MSYQPLTISQGADGYLTFFTGVNRIAGDNDLFWDRENNRLGVANTSPTYKLDVNGTGRFSNTLTIEGTADGYQLTIRANDTQSYGLIKLEESDGSDLLTIHANNSTNVFIGHGAGISSIADQAFRNIFIGHQAGISNTVGDSNVAIGNKALKSSSAYVNCIAIGTSSCENSSAHSNIGIGYEALKDTTVGYKNLAIGSSAITYNVDGFENVALGYHAGYGASGQSFSRAVLVGRSAGDGLTTGSNNLLLGWRAGDNLTTGDNNIIIGYNLDASSAGVSNELNIGDLITGDIAAKTITIDGYTEINYTENAPCLSLKQLDNDEAFIAFEADTAEDDSKPLSVGTTAGNTIGWAKVKFGNTVGWIRVYDAPSA